MKIFLFMSFLLAATCLKGQMSINDIQDKKIAHRIEFIKAKTDSFLLTHFTKDIRSKFQFEFSDSGFFQGEFRYSYGFLNETIHNVEGVNNTTHYYVFFDKSIGLKTEIGIWFYQDEKIKMDFEQKSDSLIFKALSNIYKEGLFKKIKAQIVAHKLKNPYTVIQVHKKEGTFDIILKDKSLPHNFFI